MTSEPPTTTRRRIGAMLVALTLVFSACSSSGGLETTSAEPSSTTSPTATPSSVPAPTAEPTEVLETTTPDVEPAPTSAEPEPTAAPESATVGAAVEPEAEPGDDVSLEGVLTDVVADAQGGRAFFDGTVDEVADLEDLVADAWGDGGLGLHRGHAQVENVLEVFLGIDHDGMHELMDQGMNLAATAEAVGQNPEALVASLTNSYIPFVDEGVDNGVITTAQAAEWIELLRTEFSDRVYWDGISAS